MMLLAASLLTFGLTSCSDNDNDDDNTGNISAGDTYLKSVLQADVNYTINPTYKAMAEAASDLYDEVKAMRQASTNNGVTAAMVQEACDSWKEARAQYEMSEAFLLGAASDYNIDPHIDTWPLDVSALLITLKDDGQMARLDGDDGPAVAHDDLGMTKLGFHGIEFILFRNGQPRDASELNANGKDSYNQDGNDFTSISGERELIYAQAVAGDLRNAIYQLEVCWNENAPASHKQVLEDLEYATSMPSSSNTYGWNLMNAGNAGSTYPSIKSAASAVLVGDNGCGGIADEVGLTKIGNPHTGADINYIESPYSYNSLTDFFDNIQSIENVWNGGQEGNRSEYSFANYFKTYNAELGTEVQEAIDNAQAKIKAIPAPFVLNYKSAACDEAMAACTALKQKLEEANDFIQSNNK